MFGGQLKDLTLMTSRAISGEISTDFWKHSKAWALLPARRRASPLALFSCRCLKVFQYCNDYVSHMKQKNVFLKWFVNLIAMWCTCFTSAQEDFTVKILWILHVQYNKYGACPSSGYTASCGHVPCEQRLFVLEKRPPNSPRGRDSARRVVVMVLYLLLESSCSDLDGR